MQEPWGHRIQLWSVEQRPREGPILQFQTFPPYPPRLFEPRREESRSRHVLSHVRDDRWRQPARRMSVVPALRPASEPPDGPGLRCEKFSKRV